MRSARFSALKISLSTLKPGLRARTAARTYKLFGLGGGAAMHRSLRSAASLKFDWTFD
jgi:hypothetical protein